MSRWRPAYKVASAVIEDTNIKLARVVSNVFGKSGRRMLAAFMKGERDPQQLAA